MQSMLYKTRIPFLIFFSLCSALMSYAQEGISLRDGRYEVFYTTFNSSFITPEVAKAYGFVRGANRALINVAVIETLSDGKTRNVNADIKASVNDLIYNQPLKFKRIQEQASIYYIAPFKINHKIDVYFDLQIRPENSNKTIDLKFKKRLYHDGK